MEATLILEYCDDPLLAQSQHWINAHKFGPLRFPFHHPSLISLHIREESLYVVFHYIRPLMAIHINSFLQ